MNLAPLLFLAAAAVALSTFGLWRYWHRVPVDPVARYRRAGVL